MKKIIATLALGLSLMAPSFLASAQTNVAVLNVAQIFQQSAVGNTINKRLRDEFEVRTQALRKTEGDLQKLYKERERDAELKGNQWVTEISRKIEMLEVEYKTKRRYLEEDQRIRGNEEQQKAMARVQQAVAKVAKAQGIDLVLPFDATAYVAEKLDITDKVIQELGK